MVPSPADPSCCEVPQCPLVTPSPQPGITPTPGLIPQTNVPGTIIGIGRVPTPLPTQVPVFGQTTVAPIPVTDRDGSTISPTIPPTSGNDLHNSGSYPDGVARGCSVFFILSSFFQDVCTKGLFTARERSGRTGAITTANALTIKPENTRAQKSKFIPFFHPKYVLRKKSTCRIPHVYSELRIVRGHCHPPVSSCQVPGDASST